MHKCLGCGKIYEDDAEELVVGCGCGSKFFLYYKDEKIKEKDLKKIEKDILDIISTNTLSKAGVRDKVVVFDVESVIVPEHGKYLINLDKLFREKAIVFRVDEGKYIIDFSKLHRGRRRVSHEDKI